ncbi:MAG: alpha-amylase family glycosyl hydrolase [Anaerolineales bacterium]
MTNDFLWWRDGVIYQIYPRSFADSNGDGIGDLTGITSRLDYLAELGIDAIWLSPFYPSPQADFGYDVSNYKNVDPLFGTLADFDTLVAEAHRRKIRVVVDLVLNHTSDQHPWFLESRSSRENPKRDWYLWQPPSPSAHALNMGKSRGVPNNWQSIFGGGGWEWDEKTGEYYFHMFLKQQPDVNWRNPQVRHEMLDVFRFWAERGVDGFRLDVFNAYFKDERLRNNPPKPGLFLRAFDRQQHIYDIDQPEMHPLLNEIRALLDSYPERYTVGETFMASPEKAASYCGPDKLHAAFNFDFLFRKFSAADFADGIQKWTQAIGQNAWPNYVLSNHDQPRSATRYAKGEDDARAKVVLGMLLTLRGTPFLYYGEEIGMRDISLKRHEIQDPPGKYYWPFYKGRDGCRSPMQWDASPYAGFSTVKPWLPVHPNHAKRNAEAQKNDPNSLFNFVKTLLALRKEYPALQRGDFRLLSPADSGVLAYERALGEERILIYINFSGKMNAASLPPNVEPQKTTPLLSTSRQALRPNTHQFSLNPYEATLLLANN